MLFILYSHNSVYDIIQNFISMQSPMIDIVGVNVYTYKNNVRTTPSIYLMSYIIHD